MLARDWRAGELTVLAAALVLAVGSMGTVGFFADRVKTALTSQASLLLGADVMISSDRPLPDAFAQNARAQGLDASPVIRFNSMVQKPGSDAAPVLANVKAVAPGYPLRGAIVLADAEKPEGIRRADRRRAARRGPTRGSRSASTSSPATSCPSARRRSPSVRRSSRSRKSRPGLLSTGPRLLIHADDLAATNLLQPGNRATWRLLVAEPAGRGTLAAFVRQTSAELKPGQRLENVRDVQPEVRQTLDRAEKFLGLAALVAVILSAVAVALTASRYLRRHLDTSAMLRCLGASERRTLALFVAQFVVLGIVASALGVVLALGGQALLVSLLASLTTAQLPAPSFCPGRPRSHRRAAAVRLRAAAADGARERAAVARAASRPAATQAVGARRLRARAGVIAALIGWQAQDFKTGAIMVGGVGGLILVAALAAWVLILALKRLPQRGVTWRFGLANLRRRPLASSLQVSALALGLMACCCSRSCAAS
jgi:putative ABC transport system permease protein